MSRRAYWSYRRRHRFPRMSGDEPQRLNLAAWDITFSPRQRG